MTDTLKATNLWIGELLMTVSLLRRYTKSIEEWVKAKDDETGKRYCKWLWECYDYMEENMINHNADPSKVFDPKNPIQIYTRSTDRELIYSFGFILASLVITGLYFKGRMTESEEEKETCNQFGNYCIQLKKMVESMLEVDKDDD